MGRRALYFGVSPCPTLTRMQNIRTIAKYYNRISSKRLAELLDLPEEVCVDLSLVYCSW